APSAATWRTVLECRLKIAIRLGLQAARCLGRAARAAQRSGSTLSAVTFPSATGNPLRGKVGGIELTYLPKPSRWTAGRGQIRCLLGSASILPRTVPARLSEARCTRRFREIQTLKQVVRSSVPLRQWSEIESCLDQRQSRGSICDAMIDIASS